MMDGTPRGIIGALATPLPSMAALSDRCNIPSGRISQASRCRMLQRFTGNGILLCTVNDASALEPRCAIHHELAGFERRSTANVCCGSRHAQPPSSRPVGNHVLFNINIILVRTHQPSRLSHRPRSPCDAGYAHNAQPMSYGAASLVQLGL